MYLSPLSNFIFSSVCACHLFFVSPSHILSLDSSNLYVCLTFILIGSDSLLLHLTFLCLYPFTHLFKSANYPYIYVTGLSILCFCL